ncbi:uncharacterized protein LOC123559442 isoform X2 [Mercenaria mercenaria]|uniref:uncharacterized protein LOC123559442 isoform X2 n=1 Tax=Mercenaria mercenaria TaxID=6596 RepID=UPI00234F27E0|nr:uncharacterized protein LOC123559442 isoform X2 [Mercenaria mercenaria]
MADIILLLSILSTVSCESISYLSSETSLWSSSEEKCVPATPKVDVTSGLPPAVYNVNNLDIELPDNEDVWVGYYQVERVFEYIGCAQHRQLFHTDPKFVSIKGDPGHCFPGCDESTIIGVTRTRCYCLDDVGNVRRFNEPGCTDICTHPSVACGHDMVPIKNTYLSIYKINPKVAVTSIPFTPTVMPAEEKHCLMTRTSFPQKFYWDGCLRYREVMCFYGHVDNVLCKDGSIYCTWIDAANTCFQTGGVSTSYSNSKNIDKSNNERFWTGVFKTNVVYKYNAYIPVKLRNDRKKLGYIKKESETSVKLRFAEADSMKRVLCMEGVSVTVITTTVVISVVVAAIIVAVLLMKKRRTDQGKRLEEVGSLPEQTNYITPISEEAGNGASTTIQDNGTGVAREEIAIQNPQRSAYESIGERHDGEHNYETPNAQRSAYESLGERHDEEHSYGAPNAQRSAYESLGERHDGEHNYETPNTQRSAYESLGERHDEEHSYGAPNAQMSAYESLVERHDEEHSYGASAQATSAFYQSLEEERVDTHNYKIAGQPKELEYHSLGDKIKETHCDEKSDQTAYLKPYEWVE